MNIKVYKTKINDVLIFQPEEFLDHRGYLIESYNESLYKKHLPSINFVQENESKSSFGVLRGLHYQDTPYSQAKLVRVIKGEIQDIAVDIRKDSPTYLQYVSVILNDENKKQLYIPRGHLVKKGAFSNCLGLKEVVIHEKAVFEEGAFPDHTNIVYEN